MKIDDTQTSTRAGLKRYLYVGTVAFLVIAASVLFFFLLFRMNSILLFLGKIIRILQPIIVGITIAYVLNPVTCFFENNLLNLSRRIHLDENKWKSWIRLVSILLSLILAIFVIYILGILILPQVYATILGIIRDLPDNINLLSNWIESLKISNQVISSYLDQMVNKVSSYFQAWAEGDLLKQVNTWATYFATGVLSVLTVLKNILIGLIVSIYVLASKEKFCAQGKMVVYAFFKPIVANEIIDVVRQSNKIFIGFIVGKVIDSSIIGVLCFIGLSILKVPYPLLISVIVGVTNIIPFFGPYIGAIPSTLLILVVSPIHALYFVIFILVLQQIDGNIIGPKILGDSTGLSAFWVVFSILLGGGLFGLLGMLIGVPTFAVIYYMVSRLISRLLRKRQLKEHSEEYESIESIQITNGEIVYIPMPAIPPTMQAIVPEKEPPKKKQDDTTE